MVSSKKEEKERNKKMNTFTSNKGEAGKNPALPKKSEVVQPSETMDTKAVYRLLKDILIAIKESKGTKSEAASSQCQFKLPGDIVRKGDLDNIINEIKITLKNDMPKVEVPPPTVIVSPMTVLEKTEYAYNTAKAVNKEVATPLTEMRNSVEGNNRRMDRIEKKLPSIGELARLRLIKWILVGSHVFLSILIVIGVIVYHNDIEHLKRVEWLYRWSRINRPDTEEYQDFERRMLQGTKEEREGMKTKIFNLERKAPQFIYFKPSDDWQPEPPKEEDGQSEETEPVEETKVKETDPTKMDSYELLEENMRRAKNGEHIIDPKTRK
ncbi:MAG: hypothetical protein NC214_05250 [Candidatus Amulumruptor caecigallinarius]|nr:hypothetical protein [Candidatus Amulumruptor caecigallinarius]MCM1453879.1 hypothetical protein [bacterium]